MQERFLCSNRSTTRSQWGRNPNMDMMASRRTWNHTGFCEPLKSQTSPRCFTGENHLLKYMSTLSHTIFITYQQVLPENWRTLGISRIKLFAQYLGAIWCPRWTRSSMDHIYTINGPKHAGPWKSPTQVMVPVQAPSNHRTKSPTKYDSSILKEMPRYRKTTHCFLVDACGFSHQRWWPSHNHGQKSINIWVVSLFFYIKQQL